jgi:hypothetical protein
MMYAAEVIDSLEHRPFGVLDDGRLNVVLTGYSSRVSACIVVENIDELLRLQTAMLVAVQRALQIETEAE